MTDARWDDVAAQVRTGLHYLDRGRAIHGHVPDGDALVQDMRVLAFQHAMQAGYTSLENAFTSVLDILAEAAGVVASACTALDGLQAELDRFRRTVDPPDHGGA